VQLIKEHKLPMVFLVKAKLGRVKVGEKENMKGMGENCSCVVSGRVIFN